MIGRCTIKETECMYHISDNKFYIAPIETTEAGKLYRKVDNNELKCVELQKPYSSNSCDLIYFSKVSFTLTGIVCYIEYFFELYSKSSLTGIRIISDQLTAFVNPAEHYYIQRHEENKFQRTDLLYGSDEIQEFEFNYKSKLIQGKIISGDILSRGIASDLKLNTRLDLRFTAFENLLDLVDLCKIIRKTFQYIIYNQDVYFKSVEVFSEDKGKLSICGRINFAADNLHKNAKASALNSTYIYIKKYLGATFNEVANDNQLFTKHLPKSRDTSETNVIQFMNIFSAFENEYKKLPDEDRLVDTSKIEDKRIEILGKINEIRVYNEDEIMFQNMVIQNVKRAGKEYGIRKKFFNAYSLNKESLESAFNMFGISDSVFKEKVKEIVEIRHKIVHNNYDGKIENHFDISIIEWITYAMFLKRVGVKNKNIELSLGRIFKYH